MSFDTRREIVQNALDHSSSSDWRPKELRSQICEHLHALVVEQL